MKLNRARHGISLAETAIGLALFGLIASAVAAFASATGAAWAHGRTKSNASLGSARLSTAVDELLRSAGTPVWVQTDTTRPASLLVWHGDGLVEPDGLMQVGEMMLIEHDADAGALWVYKAIPWSAMTSVQREIASVSDWSSVEWAQFAESFKSLSIVAEPTPLAGLRGGGSRGGGIARARIEAIIPEGGRPLIALDLILDDGESRHRVLSSVTLRTPRIPTNVTH